MKTQTIQKEKEDHEIPQIILDQLKNSKVHGFPFFAYTGIKGFTMVGNESLMLVKIPRNPKSVTNITISYDETQDLYNLYLFRKHQSTIPQAEYQGLFFDQLVEIITKSMGVY